jgi:hypothetical protein
MERLLVLIVKSTDFEFAPPLPKVTFAFERVAALEGMLLDWNDRFMSPEPLPEALDTVTVYVAVSPLVFSAEDGLTETELTYGKAHALWIRNGPADTAEETRVTIIAIETVINSIGNRCCRCFFLLLLFSILLVCNPKME